MQKMKKTFLAVSALLLCAQFSMDQNEQSVSGGGKEPAVNFTGTIIDNTGKPFNACHITISGLYKQIPMYSKPNNMSDNDYNPTTNTVRVDLAEVSCINVPQPDRIFMFKDRKYALLDVYMKNNPNKKYEYLVESSKRVFCKQVNGPDPIERELAFSAIHNITITGYAKKPTKQESAHKQYKQVPAQMPQAKQARPVHTAPAA